MDIIKTGPKIIISEDEKQFRKDLSDALLIMSVHALTETVVNDGVIGRKRLVSLREEQLRKMLDIPHVTFEDFMDSLPEYRQAAVMCTLRSDITWGEAE